MTDIIKSGNLFKFSDTVFNSKWKYNYVELLKNSTIRWYENKGDRSPKRSIVLKDVSSFLAFGDVVKQLPFKPEVKEDQMNLLIAVPHESNRNTRLTFFLCNNLMEMQEWVNSILTTITDQNHSQQPNNATPHTFSTSSNPPISNTSNSYANGPPNMSGAYPGGPSNMNSAYPSGPPNMNSAYPGGPSNMTSVYAGGPSNPGVGFPGGQHSAMPPYQGPPPLYSGGPSSGPPSIGFNIGGPTGGSYPQPPQNYSYTSYPQNPPMNSASPYQAGYRPYPTQPMQYSAGAPQAYIPSNPPVSYVTQPVVQPAQSYVIVDGKKRKKKSKLKNAAIGLAAGAAGAYATHKLFHGFGHGWGGGWGGHNGGWGGHHGGWGGHYGHGGGWRGSWSSLSSFDSYGSWSS